MTIFFEWFILTQAILNTNAIMKKKITSNTIIFITFLLLSFLFENSFHLFKSPRFLNVVVKRIFLNLSTLLMRYFDVFHEAGIYFTQIVLLWSVFYDCFYFVSFKCFYNQWFFAVLCYLIEYLYSFCLFGILSLVYQCSFLALSGQNYIWCMDVWNRNYHVNISILIINYLCSCSR